MPNSVSTVYLHLYIGLDLVGTLSLFPQGKLPKLGKTYFAVYFRMNPQLFSFSVSTYKYIIRSILNDILILEAAVVSQRFRLLFNVRGQASLQHGRALEQGA